VYKFKTVPDTNMAVAAFRGSSKTSPNKEYFDLWLADNFELLYSDDTLSEYVEKLFAHNVSRNTIIKFLQAIKKLGIYVHIKFFFLPVYPDDLDDIAFVLCAHNGEASHLITYDKDMLGIKYDYGFKICRPLNFLKELRRL
jgi:uncharacterized protein